MGNSKYIKMPFMFARVGVDNKFQKFVVVIAYPWDYSPANTAWMDDPLLPKGFTVMPTIDLVESWHEFDSESEAMDFIADWWINWKAQ